MRVVLLLLLEKLEMRRVVVLSVDGVKDRVMFWFCSGKTSSPWMLLSLGVVGVCRASIGRERRQQAGCVRLTN